MKHRLAALLLALMTAYLSISFAETTPADSPGSLREADSAEAVAAFLIYPPEEGIAGIQPGYIRYITQHGNSDVFRKAYWLGGEEGSKLDLTLESRYGHEFTFSSITMCTRSCYSMALSYLGIDITPGAMSQLTGSRDLDPPYDDVSDLLGVERVTPKSHVFNTMMENYLSDPSYSPVYLYLRRPDGNDHALLVVAKLPQQSRYLVVDPSPYSSGGVPYRIFWLSLNKTRQKVVNSTFRDELAGSRVLQLYQWRLPEVSGQ